MSSRGSACKGDLRILVFPYPPPSFFSVQTLFGPQDPPGRGHGGILPQMAGPLTVLLPFKARGLGLAPAGLQASTAGPLVLGSSTEQSVDGGQELLVAFLILFSWTASSHPYS